MSRSPFQTRHIADGDREYLLHCVETIDDADPDWTAVAFLDGQNLPLPVPDEARRQAS